MWCHCGARSSERMERRTRMPQGMEGRVAKVEILVGRVWDQSEVVGEWESREDVAAVNHVEAWGWWCEKG